MSTRQGDGRYVTWVSHKRLVHSVVADDSRVVSLRVSEAGVRRHCHAKGQPTDDVVTAVL